MFKKRLIAATVSIFVVGVVFGISVSGNGAFSFYALFGVLSLVLATLVVLSFIKKGIFASIRFKAVALAVAAFSFGVLRVYVYDLYASSYDKFNGKEDTVLLEISEINSSYVDVKTIKSDIGVPKGTELRLYNDGISETAVAGDRIFADIKYKTVYKNSLLSNGLVLTASGDIKEEIDGNGLFCKIRRSVSDNAQILYSDFDDATAISKAVTIGDRSGLDSYDYSLYKSSGLSHILAISGLHISLITMSLFAFLSTLSVNRKICGIIASFVAVLYTALVGFIPGAVRAAVMLLAIMIARMFLRRSDSLTFLFLSLFLLLMINPFSICSKGLQLSFLCTLGIVVFEPLMNDFQGYCAIKKYKVGIKKRIWMTVVPVIIVPMSISFVASVFTFPVMCFGFDTISYISPLTNLLCVPLFSFAVKLALLSFLIAPIAPAIASMIAYPSGLIFDFVTDVSRFVNNSEFGNLSVHIPLMIIPLFISILMIMSLVVLSQNRLKVFSVLASIFCVTIIICGIYNEMFFNKRVVVEYENTTAEYVYCQNEDTNLYIDLGGYTSEPRAIFENGRIALDNYLMLNLDSSAFERLDYISGNMKLSKIFLKKPENSYETAIFSEIKSLANDRNCDIIIINEFFEMEFSPENVVSVFGKDDNIADETLVCIDFNDKKIRFLSNGFDNAVNCDIAVLTSDYHNKKENLIADKIYFSGDSVFETENKFNKHFKNGLKFRFTNSESEIAVYEH